MATDGPRGPFLIGLDIGTGRIRGLLFDVRGHAIACAERPTPLHAAVPGGGEYDAAEIWTLVLGILTELAGHVPPGADVAGLGVASMGEAVVLADAEGEPLAPVIAWFDRRTEPQAAWLGARASAAELFAATGMPLDPTLTLFKLLWYREAMPAAFRAARHALNLADWVAFRLSGTAATDFTLASRTFCLDLHGRAWSRSILALSGIDAGLLPAPCPSGTSLGPVRPAILAATGLPGRPVVGVGGHDHLCGGMAAGVTRPGVMLDSMGTAEVLLLAVPRPPLTEATRHVSFPQGAVGLPDRAFAYIGAGLNLSGGAVDWAAAMLGGDRAGLNEAAAEVPPGSLGVGFLPHLAYSAVPTLDVAARGAFVGLVAGTTRGAMFRAVLEGLAMEARLALEALAALPGAGVPEEIRVIGGGTRNPLFLRIKASVLGRDLTVIDEPEATALGGALMGGLAAGLWPSLDAALAAIDQPRHRVAPDPAWIGRYDELFGIHRRLYPTLAPISHDLTRFAAAARSG